MPAVQGALNTESWEAGQLSVSLPPMMAPKPNSSEAESPNSNPLGSSWTPRFREATLIVKANRLLRSLLIACCGLALLGYGLDVAASADVSKLQEQARRLSEQNTELSAQLLKAISFQGIQASVVGRAGLRVPERVLIVKEIKPLPVKPYKARKHYLPIMSGY